MLCYNLKYLLYKYGDDKNEIFTLNLNNMYVSFH